ncbi:MAG: thioredoxin family protein [Patescibacteria group bacterium]|jgi:small redox-active disulfide protein 2|nr:thioredoxin family protein [Patescibacteria group bacterium]
MTIKILGSGCPNCLKLEANAKEAIENLGLEDIKIEHVTDISEIINFGVMSVPAIAIDETVKSAGRVLTVDEIKDLIN